MGNRARDDTGRDETRNVGHVDHEVCADFFGDLADPLVIDETGISAGAGNDEFRLIFFRFGLQSIVVDLLSLGVHCVEVEVVDLADPVGRRTVGQVAALIQSHGEDFVTGLQDRSEYAVVGGRTGVGLNIGMFCAEEFAGSLAGKTLDLVGDFGAGLEPLSGVPFEGLVGEDAAGEFHNGQGSRGLGSDHFNAVLLAGQFFIEKSGEDGVGSSCIFQHRSNILS